MTRLGFVIDERKCIGCQACTVACKAENGVPLGEFRTWARSLYGLLGLQACDCCCDHGAYSLSAGRSACR